MKKKRSVLEYRAEMAMRAALHSKGRSNLDKAWESIEKLLEESSAGVELARELAGELVQAGKGLQTYKSDPISTSPCKRVLSKLGEMSNWGKVKAPTLEAIAKKVGLPVVKIGTDTNDARGMAAIELTDDAIEANDFYNPNVWQTFKSCIEHNQHQTVANCIERMLLAMPRYYPALSSVPHCREVLAMLEPYAGRRFRETQEMHRTYLNDEFEELAKELAGRMGMSHAVLTLRRDNRFWTADVHFSSLMPTMATVVSTTGYCNEGTTALQALTKALERYKDTKGKFSKT